MSPTVKILVYLGLFLAGYATKLLQDYILTPFLRGKAKACEEKAREATQAVLVQGEEARPVTVQQVPPHWVIWVTIAVALMVAGSTVWTRVDAHVQANRDRALRTEFRQRNCETSAKLNIAQKLTNQNQTNFNAALVSLLNARNREDSRRILTQLQHNTQENLKLQQKLPDLPPELAEDCRDGVLDSVQ
jgi:flagellar basal body-associated protein FliL